MNLGCYNIRFSIRDYRGLKNLDNKVIVISAEKLKERKSYPSISSLTLFIVCFVSFWANECPRIQVLRGGESVCNHKGQKWKKGHVGYTS